jgi:hypothetical protein
MSDHKTTRAATRYLLTGESRAWKHLVAILAKSKGNLFVPEPGIPLRQATRRFLELWLAEKFAPYRDADADTIRAAADRGEFQHLGRQATFAIVDEIRRRTASQDALDQHLTDAEWWAGHPPKIISTNAPLGPPLDDDEDDVTLEDFLAVDHGQDIPTSKVPSALGIQPGLEPAVLQREILASEPEFKRLLGPLHWVLQTVCDLYVECYGDAGEGELSAGDPARAVAAARRVTIQTARKKIREMADIFRQAIRAGNPDVRGLFRTLATPGGPTFWITTGHCGKPRAE